MRHFEIAINNAKFHESSRNTMFNFYLVIVGLYFVAVQDLKIIDLIIPLLLGCLIAVIGIFISVIMLRISSCLGF